MLSVKEAAIRLGISLSKMYALVEQRQIAHYRLGGKILLQEADLEVYLKQCRVEAGGEGTPSRPAGPFTHLDAARLAEAWRRQGIA